MSSTLKKDLISGTFWSLGGQFGYLGITLIANIVLARILSPSEFGQLGIVLFFIVIARVLTESGLGGALVRNNNATDIDYSTIFIFNLVVSVTLCVLLIGSSGYIADFYEDQSLKQLLIASSFILIINAFQFVQSAKLVKQMRFKQKAIYEFIAILIAATAGILLAINDFGVWSLVVMQLLTALIMTALFWMFEGGHGALVFNKSSFKYHYKFGVNTTLASILNSIFDNIYQAILGKYFAIAQTGLYYQAKKLQDIPVGVINKLTQSVLFSGLSKIQDDKERFKETYQRVIRVFTVISGFIALCIFVFAHELILLILGDQWVSATFFLQVLVVIGFFQVQENCNRMLFKIFDDTKYILYLEIVKKTIQTISIIIGLVMSSIEILMFGFLISSILSYLINFYYTQKSYTFIGASELIIALKVLFIGVIIGILHFIISDITLLLRIIVVAIAFGLSVLLLRLVNLSDLKKLRVRK
jgi:teichuronic acid exporter